MCMAVEKLVSVNVSFLAESDDEAALQLVAAVEQHETIIVINGFV